jgi:hypothetical protein
MLDQMHANWLQLNETGTDAVRAHEVFAPDRADSCADVVEGVCVHIPTSAFNDRPAGIGKNCSVPNRTHQRVKMI